MPLRPICEPVELPIGASVTAQRVETASNAPDIGSFSHFHDVAELVIFGRVRGEFIADSSSHHLRDGSIVFVPAMRHHDFVLGRGAMDWLLVQIDPYVIERLGLSSDLSPLARPSCMVPDQRTGHALRCSANGLSTPRKAVSPSLRSTNRRAFAGRVRRSGQPREHVECEELQHPRSDCCRLWSVSARRRPSR